MMDPAYESASPAVHSAVRKRHGDGILYRIWRTAINITDIRNRVANQWFLAWSLTRLYQDFLSGVSFNVITSVFSWLDVRCGLSLWIFLFFQNYTLLMHDSKALFFHVFTIFYAFCPLKPAPYRQWGKAMLFTFAILPAYMVINEIVNDQAWKQGYAHQLVWEVWVYNWKIPASPEHPGFTGIPFYFYGFFLVRLFCLTKHSYLKRAKHPCQPGTTPFLPRRITSADFRRPGSWHGRTLKKPGKQYKFFIAKSMIL